MTLDSHKTVSTLERGPWVRRTKGENKPQTIVVGPLAAFVPMKQLGTNGGGFYRMNSAHPTENPTAVTNWLSCVAMMLFPFGWCDVRADARPTASRLDDFLLLVMMTLMIYATIVWSVYYDTLKPNPALHRE